MQSINILKMAHVMLMPGDAVFIFLLLGWGCSECLLLADCSFRLSLLLFFLFFSCFPSAFIVLSYFIPFFVPIAIKTCMLTFARELSTSSSPSLKSSYSRNLTLFLYQSDTSHSGCGALHLYQPLSVARLYAQRNREYVSDFHTWNFSSSPDWGQLSVQLCYSKQCFFKNHPSDPAFLKNEIV